MIVPKRGRKYTKSQRGQKTPSKQGTEKQPNVTRTFSGKVVGGKKCLRHNKFEMHVQH